MTRVQFYECSFNCPAEPTYVIIGARYHGEWIFVKNRKRGSYEMPAGHIDSGETADAAAGRELSEETGALKFRIECLNYYSVEDENSTLWGRLYLAEVFELGGQLDLEEIEGIVISETLPEKSAFPLVQAALFKKLKESL